MYNGNLSIVEPHENANYIPNIGPNQHVRLQLQYMDRREELEIRKKVEFPLTMTIRNVIEQFLKLVHHEHISPENVKLTEIQSDNRLSAPVENAHMTLSDLKITNGSTLHFESSFISVSKNVSHLYIYSVQDRTETCYKWDKTITTLDMLFQYIIKQFTREKIPRERIHLFTLPEKKLDHMSNGDKLLSELGIHDHTSIYFQCLPLQSSSKDAENVNVHVECNCFGEKLVLDIPFTDTLGELKDKIQKQWKDYLLFELLNGKNKPIDLRSSDQMLYNLGIKPGETIYATLWPANVKTRSSASIECYQSDQVTVICNNSTFESSTTKASVNDTVGELIKKIETFKKNRPLAQYKITCGPIEIDTKEKDLKRSLASFGIEPGDIINVNPIYKSSALSSTQRLSSIPTGIGNLGNTCYMNSALQCLAHTMPLTQFFIDGLTRTTLDDVRGIDPQWNQFYNVGTWTGVYADVLRNLWLSSHSYSFEPIHAKKAIDNLTTHFTTWTQQDAQEFMTFLLDEIHKELKEKNGNDSNTIIEELFFGKIQSTITCKECNHQVKTINPISFLPLPLVQPGRTFTIKFIGKNGDNDSATVNVPEDGPVKSLIQAFVESRPLLSFYRDIIVMTDDGQLDLEMSLRELSVKEVMLVESDNMLLGSRQFYRINRHTKQLTLEDCLREFCSLEHLQDSWLCEQETCKKSAKATKQLQFCNLPPVLIIQLKRFSHKDGLRDKIETFVDYPINGLDLSSYLSPTEEALYDLFAVIQHTGSINAGHYIALAKHEVNGRDTWYKFNDSIVSSLYYTDEIVSRNAYLLFYIRKDKSSLQSTITTQRTST